jgi:hypothetical protein
MSGVLPGVCDPQPAGEAEARGSSSKEGFSNAMASDWAQKAQKRKIKDNMGT